MKLAQFVVLFLLAFFGGNAQGSRRCVQDVLPRMEDFDARRFGNKFFFLSFVGGGGAPGTCMFEYWKETMSGEFIRVMAEQGRRGGTVVKKERMYLSGPGRFQSARGDYSITILETDYRNYVAYVVCSEESGSFPTILSGSEREGSLDRQLTGRLMSRFRELGLGSAPFREVPKGGSCRYDYEKVIRAIESII